MSEESKPTTPPETSAAELAARRDKGIRIFSYPKIIFLLPTLVVAIFCWIGMLVIGDKTEDPHKHAPRQVAAKGAPAGATPAPAVSSPPATDEFDLQLVPPVNDVGAIPATGKHLIVVGAVNGVLHFRIFDKDGKVVVDTDETGLPGQAKSIENLRKQLENLWPPHKLTAREEYRVVHAVTALVGEPLSDRFKDPQNLLAVLFLAVFAFNLLMMGIDFPRFTIIAIILLVLFGVFFVLWMGAAFDIELLQWMRRIMASIYASANSTFYFLIALVMAAILGIVYVTRWLDYWEILPNEILHHHGPLSDLERYPTTNLKFDKEIPDVLEHMFMGSGRLVLHVSEEKKAIVLDNVLFINTVETALKGQMSRMEVRLTTDQEVADR